ncbi:MAG TPA: hypothetical protein VHZ33_12510 [Trebonia sp.]|jgi:hypothetical protein|nr:hypothetical protein [Trebonia sp.]
MDLNRDMIALRDDVTVIEVKVDTLLVEVSELKADLALATGSLREILERLPPRAA